MISRVSLQPCPICKSGKRRKTGANALCTMDDANCFHMVRLELKTSVNDMNVTVMSTVTGCDHCATTLQGFNKHASSRREAVSDSRGVPRCTEKNSKTIYACSHVSTVRLVQSTILVSRDLHSHSSPLYHLPSELVSLSSVPMPSIDLWNTSQRFRSDVTRIHISLD